MAEARQVGQLGEQLAPARAGSQAAGGGGTGGAGAENALDGGHQLVAGEGLPEHSLDAEAGRALVDLAAGDARDEEHGGGGERRRPPQRGAHLVAVQVGQQQIADQEIGRVIGQAGERLPARGATRHRDAARRQHALDRPAHAHAVVDDEDFRHALALLLGVPPRVTSPGSRRNPRRS